MIRVPGRVNLIGEHIDYLGFPRPADGDRSKHITLDATPRAPDSTIRIAEPRIWSANVRMDRGAWNHGSGGDFGNYAKAAARMVAARNGGVGTRLRRCFDAVLCPRRRGLSSSSALLIAVTLALLEARGIDAEVFSELMELLPEGEMYVGTRGGGMDHAVCLAGPARAARCALLRCNLWSVDPEPDPREIGRSLWRTAFETRREIRRGVREEYNLRRQAGQAKAMPQALGHALSERDRVDDGNRMRCAARRH